MSKSDLSLQEIVNDLRAAGNMPEELVEIFTEESEEHLLSICDGLDRLRVDASDLIAISDIRRAAHTLKGAAGAVGAPAMSNLAYRLEGMLNILLDQQRGADESQVDICLDAADLLSDMKAMDQDFDTIAERLFDTSQAFDNQIERLSAGTDDTPTAAQVQSATDELDDHQDVEPTESAATTVAEISPQQIDEIKSQLTGSRDLADELVEIFNEEAEGHLLNMYEGLEQLKTDRSDSSALGSIRRSTHTLKGAAAAVGLEVVTRLSHRLEDMLDVLADRQITPTEAQVELCLMTTDQVQALMNDEGDPEETVRQITQLYSHFQTHMAALGVSEETTEAADQDSAALAADQSETNTDQSAATPATAITTTEKQQAAADKTNQKYLRVPLDRLDGLVTLIGEMVVNRSAFNQRLSDFEARIEDMQIALRRFRNVASDVETRYSVDALTSGRRMHFANENIVRFDGEEKRQQLDSLEFDRYSEIHLTARSLTETTSDVAVITSELKNLYGDFETLLGRQQRFNRDAQNTLMQIRMVPVSSIVNRMERTVRTVSNKIGKKVDLEVLGGSTELDKTVLEEIVDPLLHLIRNGLDHGIETPEERLSVGKPARAKLTMQALNQGTRVTIRIIDDGRGIDLERVRQKAVQRGLISDDDNLSKSELLGLIFLPGFSTADSLTDVSGRGVGMDVVREAVSRLKGTINVDSESGHGSTFTIHLPTTLAVTQALMVESNGHQFALPMQAVQQITRLDPTSVSTVGNQRLVRFNDQTQQLKNLSLHLAMTTADKVDYESSAPMLIIRAGDDEVAVTVENIIGGQDIVVKTLGDHLRAVPGYIGATVAGDGTVIPILDPAELCGQESSAQFASSFDRVDSSNTRHRKTAMVIDDSLSVRRVTTNLLRSHGWSVIDAKDGVDAIEKLALVDTPPDVFLCDMEMPRMDGLELVRHIRAQQEFERTPVVMVTSRAGEKHRRMAADAGANEHVVKPFNDEQLTGLITRLVKEAREMVGV